MGEPVASIGPRVSGSPGPRAAMPGGTAAGPTLWGARLSGLAARWARMLAARRDELEFMPAAIEIMERPPSPIGRAILWSLIAVLAAALVWACVGTIDVVATAQGRVVPTGRSKVVQPMEGGIVKAIHVLDGQVVKAGQVLVEIDTTQTGADRRHLAADLMAARMDAARLNAALDVDDPMSAFAPPADAVPGLVHMQEVLLASQVEEHRSKIASLTEEIARKRADQAGIEATIVKHERTLPLVREQAEARLRLSERGFFPRLIALESVQKSIEIEQDLTVARHQREETLAAIASLERQIGQARAEYRKTILVSLAEMETKISDLQQELIKATQRNDLQTLTAPIDGVVQQLAIHTVGGVVTPAQPLLVVAPEDDALEIEAMILNRDIGFVEAGQEAKVKLETFLFTKYGTIPGRVLSVSRDAVQDEAPASAAGAQPPAAGPAQPAAKGLVYPARIALDRTTVTVAGRPVPLGAGMAATVEVRTGSRRLIEYILSPILKYKEEGLRER